MTEHSPITPPRELTKQWLSEFYGAPTTPVESTMHVATRAAQWGADQELEACLCEVSFLNSSALADIVRSKRRPKPPSLKEKALLQLDVLNADLSTHGLGWDLSQIRRALEQLPDPS